MLSRLPAELDLTNEPREGEGGHPSASDGRQPTTGEADAVANQGDERQERKGGSHPDRWSPGAETERLNAAAQQFRKDDEENEHAGPAKGPHELSAEMRGR